MQDRGYIKWAPFNSLFNEFFAYKESICILFKKSTNFFRCNIITKSVDWWNIRTTLSM